MNFTEFGTSEVMAGLAATIMGFFIFAKKFNLDRLDITKSAVERDLIEILREEITRLNTECTEYKIITKEHEKQIKEISLERDEALSNNKLINQDLTRIQDKLTIMDSVIVRLTAALEIASQKIED